MTSTSRDQHVNINSVIVSVAAIWTVIVGIVAAVAVATSNDHASASAGGKTQVLGTVVTPGVGGSVPVVQTTLKDFAVDVQSTAVSGGLVDFNVANVGPAPHEFLIFATDLAADKLPLGADGRVDEGADGATKVFDSGDNIDVGTSKTFHAALTPGSYVLICNLPGHYTAGMHTTFTVTDASGKVPPPSAAAVIEPPATTPATTVAPAPAAPTPDASTPANASVPVVDATLKDFAVMPGSATVGAGLVDFRVANAGPAPHEFLIFATDLAPDKLPLGADGRVDEGADGATKVLDSGDNIDVGGSKTFHAALTAGNYVLICNLPGHYTAGMRTPFTVTAAPSVPVVDATLKDFSVTSGTATVGAGLVDFRVANAGPAPHEFLIFATDLAPDKLPLGADGRVDEGADGATKVLDSGDNIDVGSSKTFHAALTPGNYVLICNLPGHYTAGMRTPFTVTG